MRGRVCGEGWDDTDARVICRENGFKNGLAYNHSDATPYMYDLYDIPLPKLPFLMSNVKCQGHEKTLGQCDFSGRLSNGNCSQASTAGVLCFNDTGMLCIVSSIK